MEKLITMKSKNWTGERLETFINSRDTIDHLHRYALANQYIDGKTVLDIACGEGYGSHLMSEKAAFVYGVDIDPGTIKNAQAKYKKANIAFQQGSTDAIPLEDHCIDVVVSYETIEHHDSHEQMLLEIKRVLKPGGLLLLSTPDKLYYSDKRNFRNEFHVKELYKNEFTELVGNYFSNIQLLGQSYLNGNSVIQDDASASSPVIYTGHFRAIGIKSPDAMYLVAIASDAGFEKQQLSIFDGSEVTGNEISQIRAQIYNSATYRLGHFLLSPVRVLKKLLK